MELKAKKRKIGKHTYEVTLLTLDEWRSLHVAVWPVIVSLLPDIVEGRDVDREKMADLVASASVILPLYGDMHSAVVDLLGNCSRVEGEKGYLAQFDELFWAESDYSEYGGWLAFALEVQLVPFLRGLPLVALHRLTAGVAKALPSLNTLTGTSGGLSGKGTAP